MDTHTLPHKHSQRSTPSDSRKTQGQVQYNENRSSLLSQRGSALSRVGTRWFCTAGKLIPRSLSWKLGNPRGQYERVYDKKDAEKQRGEGFRPSCGMPCLWEIQWKAVKLKKSSGSFEAREIATSSYPHQEFPCKPFHVSDRQRFLLCCFSLSGSPCPSQCTYIIFSIHSKIPFCFWNIQFSQTSLLSFCWGHTVLQAYNLCSLADSDLSDKMMGKTAESKRNYENLSRNKILQLT